MWRTMSYQLHKLLYECQMFGLVFHVISHVEYLLFVTSRYIYKASTSSFLGSVTLSSADVGW